MTEPPRPDDPAIEYRGRERPSRERMSLFRLAAWVALALAVVDCLAMLIWAVTFWQLSRAVAINPFSEWDVWGLTALGTNVLGPVALLLAATYVLRRRHMTWPHPLLAGLAFYAVADVAVPLIQLVVRAPMLTDGPSGEAAEIEEFAGAIVALGRRLLLPLLLVLVLLRWDTAPAAASEAGEPPSPDRV